MKSRPHTNTVSVFILRALLLVLIGVTLYALQALNDTIKVYSNTNEMIATQPNIAAIAEFGDTKLKIPTYELFQEDRIWSITSKDRPLSDEKGFTLVEIPVAHGDEGLPMKVARVLADSLEQLVNAADADGEPLMISSAHRSFAEQQATYDVFVAKNGPDAAATYVLPVGASEHHTGLSVDFSSLSDECAEDSNTCSLSQSGAAWLATNAHRFGFIQRYPMGKQVITGVGFEPWHYRYVGKPLATALAGTNLTLEEAIEQIAPGYAVKE